jgi:hypothetical protein
MNDVWVTSPMPLDDNQRLRVQISDAVRNEVMQILRDWGWDPICISILPRVCSTGLLGACLYEIDLPRERQPIIDDRTIPRDEGGKREMSRECQAIVDAWYGVKKR